VSLCSSGSLHTLGAQRAMGQWLAILARRKTETTDVTVLKPVEQEHVPASVAYNILQDFAQLTLILDVRKAEAFKEGHIDGAIKVLVGSQNERQWKSWVHKQVAERFKDLNIQSAESYKFNFIVCHSGCAPDIETATANAARFCSAANQTEHFQVSRALCFSYVEFQSTFPYACSSHKTYQESRLFPAWISERLFLSNWGQASDAVVVRDGICATHVVNCHTDLECCFESEGVVYFRVPVKDVPSENIFPYLQPAVNFVSEGLASGGVVLVHCKHGRSRSASVLVAWLMTSRGWSAEQSVNFLKQCRPSVCPNPGFWKQLLAFQEQIMTTT